MGSERGQAAVEWIGILLVVAIALGAMARLAPRDEDHALAATLTHSVTCAARDRCRPPRREAFSAPPLVPAPGAPSPRPAARGPSKWTLPRPAARGPSKRTLLEWARGRRGSDLLEWARSRVARDFPATLRPALRARLREGVGRAWRTAWFACLVYERVRWAILHPESRSHEYEFPPSEALRILNDCISPLDLVRDWPLLTTR